jgi:hypothetical protein
MGWFLKLEHNGRDLYPILRERFEEPEYYVNEKVRGEVFRHFGYFMTESTGHLAEYVPYFRKNQEALDLYCDEPAFGGESGAYYNNSIWPVREIVLQSLRICLKSCQVRLGSLERLPHPTFQIF